MIGEYYLEKLATLIEQLDKGCIYQEDFRFGVCKLFESAYEEGERDAMRNLKILIEKEIKG